MTNPNPILIVDDEPDIVEQLADMLNFEGWETGSASDGVEAVLKVIESDWEAILMDIRMPNLNGINALKIVRRLAPDIPVIMFTGQAGQGDMNESNRLGAFTCLLKPVTEDKIIDTLHRALAFGKKITQFRFFVKGSKKEFPKVVNVSKDFIPE